VTSHSSADQHVERQLHSGLGAGFRHERTSSLLLVLAAALSAFRGVQFRISGGLIWADLVIVVLVASAAVGYRARRRWMPAGMIAGVGLIAVGLLIGSMFGEGNDPLTFWMTAPRDVLPPLAFAAAVSLHPIPAKYAVRMAWVVAVVGFMAVALLLLAEGDSRQSAFLSSANYAGHFVGAAWVVIASVWTRSRFVLSVVAGIFFFALLRTGSFGALAGIIGLATYLIFAMWQPPSPLLRVAWRAVLLLGIIGTAVVSLQAIGQPDFDLGSGTNSERFDRAYSTRLDIWSNSIEVGTENPFGLGYAEQVDGVPLKERLGAGEPHNDLLTMLVRGGVLAALGEVLVILALWRMLPRASWSRALLVFWAVTAMSRQTWNFRHFWLCLAIVFLVEEAQRFARQRSMEVAA
jgi:O-antigen ligase